MNKSLLPYGLYAAQRFSKVSGLSRKYKILRGYITDTKGGVFYPFEFMGQYAWLTKAVFEHTCFDGFNKCTDYYLLSYFDPSGGGQEINIEAKDLTTFLLKALPILNGDTIDE